ncbi:MAG TPA: endonuclease III [Candidatus Paceibacterota bacterium]|nr:endonuclease III [Candidatus Paceibacterota bacterium]
MISQEEAIKQLAEIKKLGGNMRLAADGWDEEWKTLIATLMSARTTDKKTIPIAEELFKKFNNLNKLSKANVKDIENIIRSVNFYKTKSKNILNLSKILVKEYDKKVPHDFNKLIELPGVGRKTANVFLAVYGHDKIGVDTHVEYISRKIGWTKGKNQEQIETDLQKLFPQKKWRDINWILVSFGQTYKSRKQQDEIIDKLKKI